MMQGLTVLTLVALVAFCRGGLKGGTTVRACENRVLKFWCPAGQLIDVRKAFYGRTQPYSEVCPCPHNIHCKTNFKCEKDVTKKVEKICDGHRDCKLFVTNRVFDDPCYGTYKYLEVLFYCVSDIDDCDPNPCQNGGTCTDLENDFKCDCRPGYEGKKCQINTDDCDPNPCQNGGTCNDLVNDFECDCRLGYKGKRCQIGTCDDFNCPSGKKCVLVRGRPTCVQVVKPGECPCPASVTATGCDVPCKNDGDCDGKQKCCENEAYRHVCSDPEH